MLQTNVLGCCADARRAAADPPHAGSSIINMGSFAAHAYEGGSAYCSAKAGELQITRVLRLELNGTGIRVGTVDPRPRRNGILARRFQRRRRARKETV